MSNYAGFKNRRSSSQLLPRVYSLLQISILALLSYISYAILTGVGISQDLVYALLAATDLYFLNKIFFKCRNIAKRNYYTNVSTKNI